MVHFVVRKYIFISVCDLTLTWSHPEYTGGFTLTLLLLNT